MRRLIRCLHRPRKSVGKYLALTGCVIACQCLKNHVVTTLAEGCSIPRSVEGDEHAVAIMSRELLLVIPCHRIRRPMRRERRHRGALGRTRTLLLAPVAAVLRSEN